MADDTLSAAVLTYVGYDRAAAVPGRFPSRIDDPKLRQHVLDIIAEADADADPRTAEKLSAWGDALVAGVHDRHPELSEEALAAVKGLLTFEYC
ncbi:hypothetical protein E4V99_02280 [Microbacterium sp. dk485]|uniref:hypothetical protein n=1 Tax=Microbacterium sp. dk485 TaxID=2560021 RepID=UPI001073BB02|nr:hypothetical protein [Microbacterium sp. dk485]TFV83929.1 hypothetical protein E4V99_02280 [Microbacterium sp. dk485]